MAERRVCSLCGDLLEEEPAIHDAILCQETELLKGRNSIKNLKAAIEEWKEAWYLQRDLIGKLSWQHHSYVCPYETQPTETIKPHSWLRPEDTVVQIGKSVFLKVKIGEEWKLVGEGNSEAAAEAVMRLMQKDICPKKT